MSNNILRAKGIISYRNELDSPEGAMEVADNAVIDETGVVEVRRGFEEYGTTLPVSTDRVDQVFEYKDRVLRHDQSTLQYDSDGAGNFSSFSGSFSSPDGLRRIRSLESKGNFYFTSSEGVKKISATSSADFTTAADYITDAGAVKAIDLTSELAPTVGGFLPPQSKCAYRVLWGYKDENNNLILGSPSERNILSNTSIDISITESFTITTTAIQTDVEGTYILFSSPSTDYFLWWSSSTATTEPATSETIGRTAVEVNVQGLTADQIRIATADAIENLADFTASITGSDIDVSLVTVGVDVEDAAIATATGFIPTNVTIGGIIDGNVIEGTFANATVTIQIPNEVTTKYFYQLYRTASVTAGVIPFNELDPGDEMNLVYEKGLTSADIIAGEVSISDIVPESFRATGTFLYTNPNSGEGILQSNERPPICKDIATFRNTVFYGNTKTIHRRQLDLISVLDFSGGTSDIIIGNSTSARTYTFDGSQEVTTLTCDTFANTGAGEYFTINSGGDASKYYVWFDKGNSTDPVVSGKIGIRVNIEGITTSTEVAERVVSTLNLTSDFTATNLVNVVTITNVKNGVTTDATIGDLTASWAITTTTQGTGEDTATNQVLLSNDASVGVAIDETARSLVRVINADSSSPVYAFYLSTSTSLPGQILLESRNLIDDNFYVATSDTNITDNFNPNLALSSSITAISAATSAVITSVGHGLTTGDEVYIFGTDSTPAILGAYEVTVLTADTFSVEVTTTVVGTTGSWYKTSTASDNEEKPNRLYFSKTGQPEAVPLLNYIDIGARDKAIERIISLRDSLFVLKEDGVYIVTGTTSPNWGARLLDRSTEIIAPDTAAVLNNQIYFLSVEGIVAATESGVQVVSRPIEDLVLAVTNFRYNFKYPSFGVAYSSDRAYIIWLPTETSDTIATQAYRYNTYTQTWTRWTKSATCGLVTKSDDKLYVGAGDRSYIHKERKDLLRTDYADRNFALSIQPSGITNKTISVSSVAELEAGDVILQNQTVTISVFRRLTARLNIDLGLDDIDYDTLIPSVGDDMSIKLNALNAKLLADDSSGTVTAKTFTNNFTDMQTKFNLLISELNDAACDTSIKDYDTVDRITSYEAVVKTTNVTSVTATVNIDVPFIQGPIVAYKGIPFEIVYSPIHFGDQSSLKQVRDGTIMFETNTFYDATASYSSDLSKNFEEIPVTGRGIGNWGYGNWGEFIWGGEGSEVPFRTYIPQQKQRCRFMRVRFEHINGRENVKITGISLNARAISRKAYR